MLPDPLFSIGSFSFYAYDLFFLLGLVVCLIVFDRLCAKKKVPVSVNKFYYILAIVSIGLGVLSAMLFQSVYNWIENGFKNFEFRGMTFMGGLIGGAVVFIVGYRLFAKEQDKRYFWRIVEFAPACIVIAHCFGRIGCFCAPCCYGKLTDSWLGVTFPRIKYDGVWHYNEHRYPTQLFEAAFLLILFCVFIYFILKDKKWTLITYCLSYSVFRFLIEFLRGDPRGELLGVMTPSQTQSVLMFLVGVFFLVLRLLKHYRPELMKGKFKAMDGYLDPDFQYAVPAAEGGGQANAANEKTDAGEDSAADEETK